MLDSRTLLFIHDIYNNLGLLTPASHSIFPPTPLCRGNHQSVLCDSVSGIGSFVSYLNSTYKWYHVVFVFLFWLISLSMIAFSFIYIAASSHLFVADMAQLASPCPLPLSVILGSIPKLSPGCTSFCLAQPIHGNWSLGPWSPWILKDRDRVLFILCLPVFGM